jgi:hypothetical protein
MSLEIGKKILEDNFATPEFIKSMASHDQAKFFASKFLSFTNKNALNILLMGKVFYDLKGRSIFDEFLNLIKVHKDEKSSQFRKYVVIGKNFDKLLNYIDVLPATWSTIYKISEYKSEDLDKMRNAGCLHPTVTANEIDSFVTRTSKNNSKKKISDFSKVEISIPTTLSRDEFDELVKILEDLKSRQWINFDLPETMQVVAVAANDTNIKLEQSA